MTIIINPHNKINVSERLGKNEPTYDQIIGVVTEFDQEIKDILSKIKEKEQKLLARVKYGFTFDSQETFAYMGMKFINGIHTRYAPLSDSYNKFDLARFFIINELSIMAIHNNLVKIIRDPNLAPHITVPNGVSRIEIKRFFWSYFGMCCRFYYWTGCSCSDY